MSRISGKSSALVLHLAGRICPRPAQRGVMAMLAMTILLAASAAWTPSIAQPRRDIPADAPRGRMTHVTELQVDLDGRMAVLATNVRVVSESNLTIVPAAIPPGSIVRYRLDTDRAIDRVWILTPEEAAASPSRSR